jgi:hypothetical protein
VKNSTSSRGACGLKQVTSPVADSWAAIAARGEHARLISGEGGFDVIVFQQREGELDAVEHGQVGPLAREG